MSEKEKLDERSQFVELAWTLADAMTVTSNCNIEAVASRGKLLVGLAQLVVIAARRTTIRLFEPQAFSTGAAGRNCLGHRPAATLELGDGLSRAADAHL
jgi:hypothetical protein